jgi:hypothetical protein
MLSRPLSLIKVVSVSWPTCWAAVCPLQGGADDAVAADGDAQGIGRNGDRRLHLEAAGGHQLAVLISLERAVAGIGQGAIRHHHLEKALPLDGDILAVVGLRQVALAVQTLGRHRPHAGTDLQPGRQRRLLGGLRPR